VRWYLRFALSYRDIEELPADVNDGRTRREIDHVTIYRWVQQFTPLLAEAHRPSQHAVGNRGQVDETYEGGWPVALRVPRR
jgi:IS6 family transposase